MSRAYATFNYSYPFVQPTQENYGQLRVDHTVSAADTLFFRWTQDDATEISNRNFQAFLVRLGSFARFATLGETHIFSPTF